MFRYQSIIILISLALGACTFHKKEEDVSGSVRVQLPFVIDGRYSLQIIELLTLENLVSLKGMAARFLIDPDTASGKLQGRDPEIRYIRDQDDVVVAKDILSLQLLTVYAHFEKMRELDQKLGVANKIQWPARIAVNARYKSDSGAMVNNALYSGQHDALLMVPFTGSALPLMANGGVLAHEHFHNIFQKLVVEPLGAKFPGPAQATAHDTKKMAKTMGIADGDDSENLDPEQEIARNIYHEVLMRALNEGLADVWGWVYSGDDSFVGRSLPSENFKRQLDIKIISGVESMANIRSVIAHGLDQNGRLGYSYALGTQYARVIRSYASEIAEKKGSDLKQVRLEVGSMLLRILPELVKKFDSLKADQFFQPMDVMDILIGQSQGMGVENCQFFAQFAPVSEGRQDLETRCQTKGTDQE